MGTNRGEYFLADRYKESLAEQLHDTYKKYWHGNQEKVDEYLKIVLDCCKHKQLITVFDADSGQDFDLTILSALLKGIKNLTKITKILLIQT